MPKNKLEENKSSEEDEEGAGGADKAVSLSGNGGRFVFIGSAGIRRRNGSKSDF